MDYLSSVLNAIWAVLNLLWEFGLPAVGIIFYTIFVWFLPIWLPVLMFKYKPKWLWTKPDGTERFQKAISKLPLTLLFVGLGAALWVPIVNIQLLFGVSNQVEFARCLGLVLVYLFAATSILVATRPVNQSDYSLFQRAASYIARR